MARERVWWTEAEWKQLADIVEPQRLSDPCASLITLVNAAMEQFPKARRRTIIGAKNVEPLCAELKRRARAYRQLGSENQSLKHRLENNLPAGDDLKRSILEHCTPAELLAYIPTEALLAEIPLPDLAAAVARRYFTERPAVRDVVLPEAPKPIVQEKFVKAGLKKVYLLGPLPAQFTQIEKMVGPICDLRRVEDIGDVKAGGDLYVSWVKFASHRKTAAMTALAPRGRHHLAAGGLEHVAAVIQEELVKLVG